MLILSYFIFIL